MEYYNAFNSISVYPHHIKQSVCGSRSKYRDGKKDTAVKVYTVNQESVYILIANVSAVGGQEELRALCDQYGIVDEFYSLNDYPCEEFTEAYLVKYSSFPSARTAKRYLDDKSFLGNTLHVFYAPEFESVHETRTKLQDRRKFIAWKLKKGQNIQPQGKNSIHSVSNKLVKQTTVERNISTQPVTYVWAGKEYTVYPSSSAVQEPVKEDTMKKKTSNIFVPRQLKQKLSDSNACGSTSEIQSVFTSNANLSHVEAESSYMKTISHVRNKISNVSVPNVRVSLKRRRRV